MSLGAPGVPMDAEHADNFEDIEKQFAVKGQKHHCAIIPYPARLSESMS